MRLKNLLGIVNDKKRDIQERLLLLTALIALIALFAVFVGGFFVGENLGGQIVIGAAIIVFAFIIYLSARFNRLRLGADICAFIIVFLVIPFTFFSSGGIVGGAPVWIILCALFITMTTQGRVRYVLWTLEVLVTTVCYYLAYQYPDLVSSHTLKTGYLDSLMSVAVVGSMSSMMIGFSIRIYREENRRSEAQRREIDELNRAQSQFFSSMSHEIRTPVNSIIGLNEMILREDISEEVAQDARNIQAASRLLLHLINDILDMSSIESGKMEITPVTYNAQTMLSDIIAMIGIRAKEKDLSLLVNIDQNLPAQLYGDEVKIKQILINVLTNAVKYTEKGSVSLSVQCEKGEGNRVIVTYSIADTGIGIKKDNIPYLFSAFKRVDTERNRYIEGTGLGLAIVKELLSLMGGSVKVNSVYMQGSTFVIDIPQESVSDQVIGSFDMQDIKDNNSMRYQKRFEAPEAKILVVDDNEMNLLVVKKLLRDSLALVDTADSGEEALKKTLANRYDLIFMDHLMSGMNGIETFHRIREQVGGLCHDTRVCILTANAGSENRTLYLREGFDGYLLKPVSGAELEGEVIRLLPGELTHILDADASPSSVDFTLNRSARKKKTLLITADSVCDLPEALIRSNGIELLPYHVRTENGLFLDGIETETREIVSYLEENAGDIRSESPQVSEYEAFFSERLKGANNIIHITMAKGVSVGYDRAVEAAQAFDNVTVIDSGHLSSGMGLMVLEAARMAQDDQPRERIIKRLSELRESVHTSFIVENTDYLARAGRIDLTVSRLTKAFMLKPMPVLALKDSRMRVIRLCFGTGRAARSKYISGAFNLNRPIDTSLLFITSAGLSGAELKEIEREVRQIVSFEEIIFIKASSAISVNCGPGSFGLLFKTID